MQGTFALFDVYTGESWTIASQGSTYRALESGSDGHETRDTSNLVFGVRQAMIHTFSLTVLDSFDETEGWPFSLWIYVQGN
jgi:hypothetical protein